MLELLPADLEACQSFPLQFLVWMEVRNRWPWTVWRSSFNYATFCKYKQILDMGSRECVSATTITFEIWKGHSVVRNTLDPFIFEEITPGSPIAYTITGKQYDALFHDHVLLGTQQHQFVDKIIFMQDAVSAHITTPVEKLLIANFEDDRIISRHFTRMWPPCSLDLNPCDFWIRLYLKNVV